MSFPLITIIAAATILERENKTVIVIAIVSINSFNGLVKNGGSLLLDFGYRLST